MGNLKPVFGAVLACPETERSEPSVFVGILSGGLTTDGAITDQLLAWELEVSSVEVRKQHPFFGTI